MMQLKAFKIIHNILLKYLLIYLNIIFFMTWYI